MVSNGQGEETWENGRIKEKGFHLHQAVRIFCMLLTIFFGWIQLDPDSKY